MRDVIVLLPGIMGSVLQKDGKDVWALSGGALLAALQTLGQNIKSLALTDDAADADDLGDGIIATRIFPDTHLIPGFWKIDGYSRVSQAIRQSFEIVPGQNYFEFPYDWRRDNRVAARKLARASAKWLASWRSRSGNKDAKLMLVAHSMGGLVARYFVECMEGWRDTRRLVTFGTPYRGSLNSLDALANGLRFGPVSISGFTELARSFTSSYQLLPRYECYDPGTGKLVRIGETNGIPNVVAEKAAKALAFHREIDACVANHSTDPAYRRDFRLHPIVGSYQPTFQSARLAGSRVEMLREYPGASWEDGDGTVPEVSAVPVEHSDTDSEMYVAQCHASIQNTREVLTQLMRVLAKGDWNTVRRFDMLATSPRIALRMSDAYTRTEPVTLRATCSREVVALTAVVEDAPTGRAVARVELKRNADGLYLTEFAPLPEGLYRATISADPQTSVSDVFIVADSRV
ncbi:lipase/acyltransferase domain-containing protein [Nitrospira sp. Nam80]